MKYNIKSFFSIAVFSVVITCVFCFMTGCSNKTDIDTLTKIDSYQEQYFKIIKRNDLFLQLYSSDNYDKDIEDLKNLYNKVVSEINPNCEFLQKYNELEQKYAENTGGNTFEINEFAQNHYNAVDKLLNDTYKAVRLKIPQDDFNKLVQSELNWLKEVDEYKNVYDKQGYGTIGGLIYLNYQIDMRNFRTLLLMLYL